MLGIWEVWDMACSGCGVSEMWEVRDVGCLPGCGMLIYKMSLFSYFLLVSKFYEF